MIILNKKKLLRFKYGLKTFHGISVGDVITLPISEKEFKVAMVTGFYPTRNYVFYKTREPDSLDFVHGVIETNKIGEHFKIVE